MSVWTTKTFDRDRKYIVIKHPLPNVNNSVMGVKFRGGYAVVEANSKTYHQLKKVPILKNFKEFPLLWLEKLPFINRAADIKVIYGMDVFQRYSEEYTRQKEAHETAAKVEEEKEHIENSDLCTFRKVNNSQTNGELCKRKRLKESPSGHCFTHLLQDPQLELDLPMAMTSEDRKKMTLKVLRNIKKYIKNE